MNAKIVLCVTLMLMSLNACAGVPTSHFSVLVHEENGDPIEGVAVQGGFSTLMRDDVPGPNVKAVTDKNGKAEISGPAYFSVYVDAIKEGYYKSGIKIPVNQKQDQDVSILLRPKKNPVAMYAKNIKIQPVILGEEFGYDFMEGDYVVPYGSGKTTDLIIKIHFDKKDFWNYEYYLSIRFTNPLDGLKPFYIRHSESNFKSSYMAPLSDYINEWDFKRISFKNKKDDTNLDSQRNYYFRVRTVANKDDEIESAHYGKIYGEFPEIKHYLNPTINDRNVEFNPRQNLFKNLKHLEKVGAP